MIDDSDNDDLPTQDSPQDLTKDVTAVYKNVLNFARVNSKSLGFVFAVLIVGLNLILSCRKKDKYQVLYFPLGPPLTEAEKQARKVVTSQRI